MTTFTLRHRHDPLRPPEAPGLGRGMAFALVAHIALVIAISINVQWRSKTIPTFEAELWSAVPQAAAPKAQEPEPEPEPLKPEVKPEPKPEPKGPSPQEVQAQRDAEIAVAKARKEEKLRRETELEEQKKLKALKEKQDKAERDKQEKLDKAKQEKLDKEKQTKLDKAAEAKRDAQREAQRQENIRRIQGMAGASGGPTATGTAAKSSGPSSSYGGRIAALVRRNIIYGEDPANNPVAEVDVRAAPDGMIISRKLVKASGDAEWDAAVLRAIDKTEKLPTDTDGSVPSRIVISFRYRD